MIENNIFIFIIADYGEYPKGVLLKSKLLNYPKFEVKHIDNDEFELNLTFFDEQNNIVKEKIICNSRGVIKK